MKLIIKISFFILLFIKVGFANDIVKINAGFLSNELSGKLYYCLDTTANKIPPIKNFKPYTQTNLNLGLTESTAWLMFDCKSECRYTQTLVLDIDAVYAEGVNFYVFENGKILSKYENYSWKKKIKDRIIKTRYFAFPIELKPNQELRVIFSMKEKNGFFYAPTTLYERNWYHEQYDRFNVLYSIPLIFIGIVSIITIILWLFIKERALIYYFLYQFGFLIYSLNSEGIMAQYFPEALSYPFWYVYGVTISYCGYLLLSLNVILISLASNELKLLKIIIYSYILCSVLWCLFIFIMGFDEGFSGFSSSLASFSYILIFVIAIFGLLKKTPNSTLYFIAILPVLFSALLIRITVFDFINFDIGFGSFVTSETLYLMTYYAPLFEVIVLGIGLIIFFRRERENLLLNLLDIQKQKINIQETERRRLAQDLHDDLGGTLSVIKGRISSITANIEIINLVEKAIMDLRIVSRNLMPPELGNEGLVKAIFQTIERLQSSSKIEFTFISFGNEIRLSEEKELNIYRIITELLNNILKHSKASKAVIQLIFHEKYLHVTVEDNGIGIKSNVNSWGMGLKNVNSRAKFISAKIFTDFNINGTTFFIEIPYN